MEAHLGHQPCEVCKSQQAEIDRGAGQVAALRSYVHEAAQPEYGYYDPKARALLADTEAAAREHDQRLRVEGAREFAKRVQEEAAKGPSLYATSRHAALAFAFKDVLADLEADHASR